MHGGEVDRVELEVGLAVEALVGAFGVVDDVDGEVAVVPGPRSWPPTCSPGDVWVGPCAAADRLVVGEQRREPRERAEPVDSDRIGQGPSPRTPSAVQQLVEVADEVRGAVGAAGRPPSTREAGGRRRFATGLIEP